MGGMHDFKPFLGGKIMHTTEKLQKIMHTTANVTEA